MNFYVFVSLSLFLIGAIVNFYFITRMFIELSKGFIFEKETEINFSFLNIFSLYNEFTDKKQFLFPKKWVAIPMFFCMSFLILILICLFWPISLFVGGFYFFIRSARFLNRFKKYTVEIENVLHKHEKEKVEKVKIKQNINF